MISVSDRLIQSVRSASAYNANARAVPVFILWPAGDRQWEPVIPRHRSSRRKYLDKDEFLIVDLLRISIFGFRLFLDVQKWLELLPFRPHLPSRIHIP